MSDTARNQLRILVTGALYLVSTAAVLRAIRVFIDNQMTSAVIGAAAVSLIAARVDVPVVAAGPVVPAVVPVLGELPVVPEDAPERGSPVDEQATRRASAAAGRTGGVRTPLTVPDR